MQLTNQQMDLTTQNKFFTFLLENKLHGINKKYVDSVVPHDNLLQLPKCPHFMKGFLIFNMFFIPVIDIKVKLNLPETILTRNTKIVVLNCNIDNINFKIGILIDKIIETYEIEPGIKNINLININNLITENDYITFTTILNNNLKKIKQKTFSQENIRLCE